MYSTTIVFLKNTNQAYALKDAVKQKLFHTSSEGSWVACACVVVFSLCSRTLLPNTVFKKLLVLQESIIGYASD